MSSKPPSSGRSANSAGCGPPLCRCYTFQGGPMLSQARFFIIALLLTMAVTASAQPAPMKLDRLVPAERQKQLGFDKLSPQQRAEVVRLLQEVYQIGLQEGLQERKKG